MLANVDRLLTDEPCGLECKTASALTRYDFENGDIPSSYYCQCMHYMAVTGFEKWYIAVLVMGKGFFWYEINRNEEEIEALINKIDIVEESMVYEDNDKICAEIVYSKDNMAKNNLATVDDVRSVIEEEIKIINKNLPIYKYIREFSLTDVPLIKTTTQKIKRHEEMKKIKGE